VSSIVLAPDALASALAVRDLTDPALGTHAVQRIAEAAIAALAHRWDVPTRIHRWHPVVPVEDNYDRLGYSPDAVARDARYTRYVSETCVLRSHTSAMIPAALRALASEPDPPADVLIACTGIVYRRDAIDRVHTGTPHQLDLWRIRSTANSSTPPATTTRATTTTEDELVDMIGAVMAAVLPGLQWRTTDANHPYTERGRQVDVLDDATGMWVEVGECGLASAAVLGRNGYPGAHGLAMGLGLDRILIVRKRVPDIRLLRSADRRVASQMLDLEPYRAVSSKPAVERDLSLAVADDDDAETLGDRVREALGDRADDIEDLVVLADTAAADVPPAAAARLGLQPGQKNVLLRVVLRPIDHTLTSAEANVLRDRIYAALHQGSAHQWAGPNHSTA
jgi:phenylalanyl-tRNA synthetase alpha chain